MENVVAESIMENEYYFWLCDLIRVNHPDRSYWLLIKTLHAKIFCWSVPNDDNRIFEAKRLRELFCEEHNYDWMMFNYHYEWVAKEVSMLELIVALAYLCENIMIDQNDNLQMADWFWRLLSNVGLDTYTDEAYYFLNKADELDQILEKIILRRYKRDGRGGLFPLKKAKSDQRKVELWYQMCAYLLENYYFVDEIS